MYFHSGTATGFHSWVGFIPGRDAGLVLLSNSAAQIVEEIGPELLKAALGLPAEIPKPLVVVAVKPEALRAVEGSYLLDKTPVRIKAVEGHLEVFFGDKAPSLLWPRSERSYFCKEWDCRVDFTDKGAQIKMYYNSYFAPKTN
jgi:hypothetical protein